MNKKVRVRFAPSPTGLLHIGGVRTALFNFLFAKQNTGTFILRLEDTDRDRFVPEAVDHIVESLKWLGLEPDEGYWLGEHKGSSGPYIQSERLPKYKDYAQQLVKAGLAYRSSSSPEQLEKLRAEAAKNKRPFIYRKAMEQGSVTGDAPIRLDIQAAVAKFGLKQVEWQETTGRKMSWDSPLIDDFILLKADGYPTYNFANVVDDHEMKISHVLRGDEFLSSTPKHILLYNALGITTIPQFVHLPVINGTDGKKLSKRTGDVDVLQYRDKGYLPEALLNFLALLGWNDGTEKEIFNMDELVEAFKLDRVQQSPAIFDPERLNWMNGLYIRQLEAEELLKKAQNFWPKEAATFDAVYKKQVLGLVQERLKFLAELPELTNFFFKDPPAKQIQLDKTAKDLLREAHKTLEKTDWHDAKLEEALRRLADSLDVGAGDLFKPIRLAITGKSAAPGLFETMMVLGKEVTLRRVEATFKML